MAAIQLTGRERTEGRALQQPLSLPPERPARSTGGAFPIDLSIESSTGAKQREVEAQLQRRRWFTVGFVLLVVLGSAAYGAHRWWTARVPTLPLESLTAKDEAVRLLRRDDTASLESAIEQLQALIEEHPTWIEPQAYRVIALAFLLDDSRLALQRLDRDKQRRNAEIARLQKTQSPGDWRNRVNAIEDELQALESRRAPFVEATRKLDDRLNTAFVAMNALEAKANEEQAAQLRAQALYYSVKGADQAIGLTERYRSLGIEPAWADLAYAEYVINAKAAPASVAKAREAIEALRTADSAFIRPHVIAGRLAMLQDDPTAANDAFQVAEGFNSRHQVARHFADDLRGDLRPSRPSSPVASPATSDPVNGTPPEESEPPTAPPDPSRPPGEEAAPPAEPLQPTQSVPDLQLFEESATPGDGTPQAEP